MKKDNFYREILDRMTSGVYFVNRDREITYWNMGAERLSGYPASEVIGKKCSEFLNHIDENGQVLCGAGCPLLDIMKDGIPRQAEVYMLHKMGQRVPVLVQAMPIEGPNGMILGAVEIFSDISSLKLAQAHIRELTNAANMDALTGIYNRRGLEFILGEWFHEFQRYRYPFGLVFVDVDRFKPVNDRYGHDIGDQVLIGISKALLHNLRETDAVGRWGGDEFLVLLRDVNENSIGRVVEKIKDFINSQTYMTDEGPIFTSCSLGSALPSTDEDLQALIKRADLAMYQVKKK